MGLFSFGNQAMVGVDISAAGIKLLELGRSRGRYTVKSMATVPLPRDSIVENIIMDSGAVIQALTEALEQSGARTRNAAISVSGNAVIINTVSMPIMSELELESQIAFEAEQYIPYSIDDVYLDFQILNVQAGNEQMEVVLAACKHEVVEDYLRVLEGAEMHPCCVDCDVFALQNTSELLGLGKTSELSGIAPASELCTYALINIGANLININILQNGRMIFVRDQFYGGNHLTEVIQKIHGLSFQAAEELKCENFHNIGAEALDGFYTGLSGELIRSLDFYAANHADFPVQKLFLSGGTALLPGIDEEIERRLNIETEIMNPCTVIGVGGRGLDAEGWERIGPRMAVPVGLALRSFSP